MRRQPATRNRSFENLLCEAIRNKKVILLRYRSELHWRTFNPHILFESDDKVFTYGIQTHDDSKPFNSNAEHRKFEVGLINQLTVTDNLFVPDRKFNSHLNNYPGSVLCAIDRPHMF